MLLKKSLYINAVNNGTSGATVISERNYELIGINSSLVFKYSVCLTLQNVKQNVKSLLIDFNLVNETDIKNIIELIKINEIDTVFIDSSMFGNVAKSVRAKFPSLYIIAFFHNVEYDYFKELIRVSKKTRHYFTLHLIKKAEKQIIKCANVIITLNKRDSDGLNTIYKRKSDLILPTSFKDNYDEAQSCINKNNSNVLNLLFVGSYFPPNIYGVDWFVKNVLTKIKRKVCFFVVGNGFELHKFDTINNRVKLIGRVDDLSKYYYLADLVVAPIFHGSGMKTKVAEALMFNKQVAGTKEAFEGYEINSDTIGEECNTADEFVNYIENFSNNTQNVRDIFFANYSFETIKNKFYNFLNDKRK
jgi:polysaccharide biosynthesis protein PslH